MAGSGAKILFGLEKALENFLRTVCDDYSLPYEELYERYFIPKPGPEFEATSSAELPEASESAIAAATANANKKTRRAKPSTSGTSTANANRKPCAGLTTKKTACKKFALDGFDFCACHLPKDPSSDEVASTSKPKPNGNTADDTDDMVTPEAKKKTGKSKGKAKAQAPDAPSKKKTKSFPTHTHDPLDADADDDETQCELCSESGDSASTSTKKKLEYDLDDDVKTRLSAILSQIDEAGSDSDATHDDDE